MDTTNLNTNITNINNIRFDETWKGSASENKVSQLNNFMQDFNKCTQDITAFSAILLLREQYIKICDRIKELDNLINSCGEDHSDEDCSCSCGAYAQEIAKLEQERTALRNKIIGLLGQFSGITPEVGDPVDLTTFDELKPEILEELPTLTPTTSGPINEVPLYNQLDYTCKFGNVIIQSTGEPGTVRNSGCGITSLAMVASYLKDDPTLTPDVLAEKYGKYNTSVGADWALFRETAEELGLGEVKQVHDWKGGNVEQALRDGCVVISNQRKGKFTNSGHYVVLTGISEVKNDDGEVEIRVHVNDPNGANWGKGTLKDGFENGFKYTDISYTSAAYWIYEPKDKKNE